MEVKIERLDDFGRGIAFVDEKICFIENTLPEEIVEIEITKNNKKYLEGTPLSFKRTSPNRIDNKCPYYQVCGGCQLGIIKLDDENIYKENKVKNLLKKFTNLDHSLVENIKCHSDNHYRNKITLHGKDGKLGLYKSTTNEIVEIEDCLLVDEKINEIIKEINKINKNITKVVIKVSNDSKYSLVDISGEVKEIESLEKIVDLLIINKEIISNNSRIETSIGHKKFYQASNSFFQVNKTLTKELYDEALNLVKEIKPETILDLYCGVGTIGIYVSDYCKELIGIDYNKSNIDDANLNKELNKTRNINFICSKVEDKITSFKDIDLVIVDPPRAGLDKKTKNHLLTIKPKSIIYISCDPVTFVRDLNDLENNYQVKYIKPFNMFPRTYHVECVALLGLKNTD